MALKSLAGKTAFVTGGANGIGFGIAQALVAQGANVMLADIDEEKLQSAANTLGENADTVLCDVTSPEALKTAAEKTMARFGKVHVLVNNAGVGGGGVPGETSLDDWRWVVNINFLAVVYGVEIFVPLIKAHGEGGHIINTASMAGHVANALTGGPYNSTKYAVVGYSETLRAQLAQDNIGCSVLCPGWVDTDIHKSSFRAPSNANVDVDQAMNTPQFQAMDSILKSGLSPKTVGEWTVECMMAERMYIFTHPEMLPGIDARLAEVKADYQACMEDPRFSQ
ncbi:MAG: SDR family NAD(P)-dependent oxidoreductase [Pseudomonadota bacterium]